MDHSDLARSERIDRYLAGYLGAEEARAFEAALAQDNTLRQEYEDAKMSRDLVQNYALRREIQSIRQVMRQKSLDSVDSKRVSSASANHQPPSSGQSTVDRPASERPTTKARPLKIYIGRIAAGIVLLLIGFLGFQYATLSSDSLYAEKIVPYQLAASRGAEAVDGSAEALLEQQYQASRFAEVAATYEQLDDPSPMAMFLAGNAYLRTDQPRRAVAAFQTMVAADGSQGINRFEEDVQYYLALSYLRANRIDKALPLLEAINDNPSHSYHSLITDYYLWKVRFLDRVR